MWCQPPSVREPKPEITLSQIVELSWVHSWKPPVAVKETLTLVGGDLTSPETVNVVARVLRCSVRAQSPEVRRYSIALEFIEIAAEDQKRLRRYLNSL